MPLRRALWAIAAIAAFVLAGPAVACRKVADAAFLKIAPDTQVALDGMHIDRALAFRILLRTAIPETQGCWAFSTGNSDGQIVSVGALQWNYGQQTLQFLLFSYRRSFLTNAAFDAEIRRLMPRYGALIFSEGCRGDLTPACRRALLAHQHHGKLDADMAAEYDALFESDAMLQVQLDRYLSLLTSLRSDISRLFGDGRPTELRMKWALDTKTQQGHFPKDAAIRAYRTATARYDLGQREAALRDIVGWYRLMCSYPIMRGVRYDCEYNTKLWPTLIASLYHPGRSPEEPEVFDLLNLSFIRAIGADGEDGAYQPLAFQRRATIIFGRGSVAGRRF